MHAINFLKWCNEPIYKHKGDLGFTKRATPQFPNNDVYVLIDNHGNWIPKTGIFLTAEELYKIYTNERREKRL